MLDYTQLKKLAFHHHFLAKKLKKSDFFLVGGCIRELLLGTTKTPLDIDFTMAGNPLEIYEQLDKEGLSHFMTEKFGTITLIPKDHPELKYELTPLRAESGYQDTRHPDEIFWSDDLLLDVQRRDFRINAIYYHTSTLKRPSYEEEKLIQESDLLKILEKEGFIYLANQATLIVQDEKLLHQLLPNAQVDSDFLYYLLDIQRQAYCFGAQKTKTTPKVQLHLLLDPAKGIQDLVQRKLQTVGNPDTRFQEDALRLLRALRFVNVINQKLLDQTPKKKKADPTQKVRLFDFETETWKSIKKNHELLTRIAKERIREELMKSFTQGNPFGLVGLLDEAEMLPIVFPALALTKHVDQPIRYHPFDVYSHILLTLYHLQAINSNPLVRFGMLYHDVGKVGQYAEYGKNLSKEEIRNLLAGPLNHRFSSAVLAEEDFKKLGFSRKEIEEIQRYIREHHTPGEILLAHPQNWAKKLRKLLSENGFERVNNLLDINIADRMGMYNPLQNASDLSDSRYLKELLLELEQAEGQFTAKDLAIKGKDIMEHFKLKPGKLIGELLELALDWVLGDIKKRNKADQILANLANHLKNLENKQQA